MTTKALQLRDIPMTILKTIAAAGIATFTIVGVALAQGPKEQEGGMLGGILGGILGNVIPGGNSVGGQIARTLAPTIGSLIGSSIGAQLDEQDRQALAAATRSALSSGKRARSTGKQSGYILTATPGPTTTNASGQQCRTITQEVVKKDGSKLSDTVSGCKGSDGKWAF
jgi:surface antigen